MALWPAPHMALFSIVNQTILTEIGTDLSRFPTEKHFASWLGLAPHHEISGGKLLRNGTLKGNHRAAQTFRQTARHLRMFARFVLRHWPSTPDGSVPDA